MSLATGTMRVERCVIKMRMSSLSVNADAYRNAIANVGKILNDTLGTRLCRRDVIQIDALSEMLGIEFDENGEILNGCQKKSKKDKTISKDVFENLLSLLKSYDEYYMYIDDGRQYRLAEKRNEQIVEEFVKITSKICLDMCYMPHCGGDAKETILVRYLNKYGFSVEC